MEGSADQSEKGDASSKTTILPRWSAIGLKLTGEEQKKRPHRFKDPAKISTQSFPRTHPNDSARSRTITNRHEVRAPLPDCERSPGNSPVNRSGRADQRTSRFLALAQAS